MKTQANPKTATVKKTSTRSRKIPLQRAAVKTADAATQDAKKRVTNSLPSADEIAARAYKIWQQQGCPEGCEEEHWWQAEQEIIREESSTVIPQF